MCFVLLVVIKVYAMAKKILIVDDNMFMIEVMTYILINKGYEVIALTDGDEVLNNIAANHPDLVILDAILPGMDGRDVCKLLKLNKSTKKFTYNHVFWQRRY